NALLKQTAAWIVSHRPDWGGALANYFRERLAALPKNDTERAELQAQLSQLAKDAAIQNLLGTTVTDAKISGDARALALRAMAGSGVKETPTRWFADLTSVLSTNDPTLVREAVAAAR